MKAKSQLIPMRVNGKKVFLPSYMFIRQSDYEKKLRDLERRVKLITG